MMRRKLSICFFCAFVASLVVMLGVFEESTWRYPEILIPKEGEDYKELNGSANSTQKAATKEEESIPISKIQGANLYVLREEKGEVVVYHSDMENVFLYTGIEIEQLPSEVQNRLAYGICFETEEEMISFLETYSS